MASSPGARDDAGAPERRPEPFDTDIVTFKSPVFIELRYESADGTERVFAFDDMAPGTFTRRFYLQCYDDGTPYRREDLPGYAPRELGVSIGTQTDISTAAEPPASAGTVSETDKFRATVSDISKLAHDILDASTEFHNTLATDQAILAASQPVISSQSTAPAPSSEIQPQTIASSLETSKAPEQTTKMTIHPPSKPRPKTTGLGNFASVTSNKNLISDRYGERKLQKSERTPDKLAWRLEDLFALVLPYLPPESLHALLVTSSRIWNTCSPAVAQIHCHLPPAEVPVPDDGFPPVKQILTEPGRQEGVVYDSTRPSDSDPACISIINLKEGVHFPRSRGSRQRPDKRLKRLVDRFEDLDTLNEQVVQASRERCTKTAHILYGKVVASTKAGMASGKVKYEGDIDEALQRAQTKARLRLSEEQIVGVRRVILTGLTALAPEMIESLPFKNLRGLRWLSINGCQMFTIQHFPSDYPRFVKALAEARGSYIQVDWDFEYPRTGDAVQGLRKSRALGAMMWCATNVDIGRYAAEAPQSVRDDPDQLAVWIASRYGQTNLGYFNIFAMMYPRDGHPTDFGRLRNHMLKLLSWNSKQAGSPHAIDLAMQDVFQNQTQPAELIKLVYTWAHGRNLEVNYNPNSNENKLFHCSSCDNNLPGIFFEIAQIKRARTENQGTCLGCKLFEIEREWLQRGGADQWHNHTTDVIVQYQPQTYEAWREAIHKVCGPQPVQPGVQGNSESTIAGNEGSSAVQEIQAATEVTDEDACKEFAEVCPVSLLGVECSNRACQMAVAQYPLPAATNRKLKSKNASKLERQHPWIKQGCKTLIQTGTCSEPDNATHQAVCCHDPTLLSGYRKYGLPTSDYFQNHRSGQHNPAWISTPEDELEG